MANGNILSQIKHLIDNKMYDDAKLLAGCICTMADNGVEVFASISEKISLYCYLATAFYKTHEYRKAESLLSKALHLKKMASRNTKQRSSSSDCSGDSDLGCLSEVDIKWKIYQCQMQLRTYKDGQNTLESILPRHRDLRVNMALGQLYLRYGNEKTAISAFKDVLRDCPYSLEAARSLLHLGMAKNEVLALMRSGFSQLPQASLLIPWMEAHVRAYGRDYQPAIDQLSALDQETPLHGDCGTLSVLGETQYMFGDYDAAETTFRRVHSADQQWLRNMDIYAFLLHRSEKTQELEKVSLNLLQVTEHRAEPWIAFGYLCYVFGKIPRSLYFAQKAFMLNCSCLQSLILKGMGLLKTRKVPEALMHFTEARRLSPHNYEVMHGIVECYWQRKKAGEAVSKAYEALKILGNTPRTLCLYAMSLAVDNQTEKAKQYFEKAHRIDPYHLDTVYQLAELYLTEDSLDKGIALLRSALVRVCTSKLQQLLGDFLLKKGDFREALDHYTTAVNLDPNNTQAKKGISNVESENHTQRHLFIDSTPFHIRFVVGTPTQLEESDDMGEAGFSD